MCIPTFGSCPMPFPLCSCSGGFHQRLRLVWSEQNCWSFLSSVLQDRGGYGLAFWGGLSWCKGFASPASLIWKHCYFLAEAGRGHTAFGRMVSFSFLQKKSQGAHQISVMALIAFPLNTVRIWIPLYIPMFWSVSSTSLLQTGSILKQVWWFGNWKCVPSISEGSGQNENLSLHLKESNVLYFNEEITDLGKKYASVIYRAHASWLFLTSVEIRWGWQFLLYFFTDALFLHFGV